MGLLARRRRRRELQSIGRLMEHATMTITSLEGGHPLLHASLQHMVLIAKWGGDWPLEFGGSIQVLVHS